jgi:hypothetical protein
MADPKALPPVQMTDDVQIEPSRRRRRQRRRGEPNRLTMSIEPVDGTEWGPAMRALPSDRHRAFVLALYQIKPGYGAHVKAAKMAGFGTSTSSAKSWSVIASNLAHDEKIQAALHEEDQKRIRAVAPRAVQALERLIEDPKHKDHARAIGMTLERVQAWRDEAEREGHSPAYRAKVRAASNQRMGHFDWGCVASHRRHQNASPTSCSSRTSLLPDVWNQLASCARTECCTHDRRYHRS